VRAEKDDLFGLESLDDSPHHFGDFFLSSRLGVNFHAFTLDL